MSHHMDSYDPLYEWINDNDRLLTLYTVFYAWTRRQLLWRFFHTWILRKFQYRHFRQILPQLQMGIHYDHSRMRLNRTYNLPDRQHYITISVDHQMQAFNGIPLDQMTFHPTPAISILYDFVANKYAILPRRQSTHNLGYLP